MSVVRRGNSNTCWVGLLGDAARRLVMAMDDSSSRPGRAIGDDRSSRRDRTSSRGIASSRAAANATASATRASAPALWGDFDTWRRNTNAGSNGNLRTTISRRNANRDGGPGAGYVDLSGVGVVDRNAWQRISDATRSGNVHANQSARCPPSSNPKM